MTPLMHSKMHKYGNRIMASIADLTQTITGQQRQDSFFVGVVRQSLSAAHIVAEPLSDTCGH